MNFHVESIEHDNHVLYFIADERGASIEDAAGEQSAQRFADKCSAMSALHPEYTANQVYAAVMDEMYLPAEF